MAIPNEEKVFISDICDKREKSIQYPKRPTERAEVFIRVGYEIAHAWSAKTSPNVDKNLSWSENFAFEKQKQLQLKIEERSLDLNDANIEKLKDDTFRQMQNSTILFETTGKLIRRIVICLLFLDIAEMICVLLIIPYMAYHGLAIETMAIWDGIAIFSCIIQLVILIRVCQNAKNRDVEVRNDIICNCIFFFVFLFCAFSVTLVDILSEEKFISDNINETGNSWYNLVFQEYLIGTTILKFIMQIMFIIVAKWQIKLINQAPEVETGILALPSPKKPENEIHNIK